MSKRPCPECGAPMDRQSRRCASCSGFGTHRHHTPAGYVRVWCPGHPIANADGYALEHRKVLADLGIDIPPGYHVHHVNGRKDDNRPSNLEVVPAADHLRGHLTARGSVVNQYGVWPLRAGRCGA